LRARASKQGALVRQRAVEQLGGGRDDGFELVSDTPAAHAEEYFAALLAAHDGDATRIWSIDGVHLDYLPAASSA
jgi:hypothetical protein